MTNESILISEVIPATPQRIFSAWMDSAEHSAFTGDEATVVPEVGGEHRAAGGYIQGRTLELSEGTRIVQSWRTTEFPPESPDSRVEITFEPTLGGTLVTLLHTDIPVGQGDRYRQSWNEYYLSRMKAYFADGDQSSADFAELGGAARDRQALEDDGDDDEGDLDVEVEIVEADAITSVGHHASRDAHASHADSQVAPGRPNGVPKVRSRAVAAAAPKPASRPAKLMAKAATGAAKAPAQASIKMSAKASAGGASARRGAAKKRPAAKMRPAAKKVAKTAARRSVKGVARKPIKLAGKAKAAARRAAPAGKARAAKKTVRANAAKPGKKPAGKVGARKKPGKAKGASPPRGRRY